MRWRRWARSLFAGPGGSPSSGTERTSGAPPSANGASSLHLFWRTSPGAAVTAAEATLEVTAAPPADRLVFWALQATMLDGAGEEHGTGHLGLQHHPAHPGGGAANWGGYRPGGGELPGGPLGAPSATANVNTCDFAWAVGRRYRLRIEGAAPGRWRGSVTDLDTGSVFVVRDLEVGGDRLDRLMVWTESFAHCEEGCAVRWSDLALLGADGARRPVTTVVVNYQRHADGGCATTTAGVEGAAFLQVTGTLRAVPQGTTLRLPVPSDGPR